MGRYQQHVHVRIAEQALGHKLPKKAVVHHVNGNGRDNQNRNIVICDSKAYHLLIHVRERAYRATGNVHYRKCTFCKRWDAPERLYKNHTTHRHVECFNLYQRNWKARRS